MTSGLVFNHHSLPFDAVENADAYIPEFLRVCIKAQNIGFSTIIVDDSVDSDWFRLELANGYFWQDWHGKNQSGENKDLIRAFRSIATKQPFFSAEDMRDGADLLDVSLDDDSSLSALCAAAWHEAPLTSMPTRPPWLSSPLQLKVESLDAAGKILTRQLDVLNFYSLESFEKEVAALLEQRNLRLNSGRQIWEKRKTLFPNLTFCGKAQEQLNGWSASNTVLNQVLESLTFLNTFCEKLADGTYDCYSAEALREIGLNHRVSGESETVMKNPQLRKQRKFWLPEGREKIFENHVKLTNGYRIHFYPENGENHIYIGYIGSHLRLK